MCLEYHLISCIAVDPKFKYLMLPLVRGAPMEHSSMFKQNPDNDYGQTLFLDGFLMDFMIDDDGEIWCKS